MCDGVPCQKDHLKIRRRHIHCNASQIERSTLLLLQYSHELALQIFIHPGRGHIQKILVILNRYTFIIKLRMLGPVILNSDSHFPHHLVPLLKITKQINVQITAFPMLRTGIHFSQAESLEHHHPHPRLGKNPGKLFQSLALPEVHLLYVFDAQRPADFCFPRHTSAYTTMLCLQFFQRIPSNRQQPLTCSHFEHLRPPFRGIVGQ